MEAPTLEIAFAVTALLEPVKDICIRHRALLRVIPIYGGTVEGPGLQRGPPEVLPSPPLSGQSPGSPIRRPGRGAGRWT